MKKFTFLLAGMFTAVAAHAATVNWSAVVDTGFIDSSGAALAAGNYVRIGYFGTLSDAQVSSNSLTLSGISNLDADFHEFGSGTVGTGVGGSAGIFNFNSTPLYSSLPGFDPNSQIYFWALNSTNNTSLAAAVSTATQTAIGYVPFANLAAWQFPANDLGSTTIDLSNLAASSRQILAGTYVAGTSASLTPILGSPNAALQLADVTTTPVPEPTTLAVGVLTLLTAAGVRRRRK